MRLIGADELKKVERKRSLPKCGNCRFAINPYKDPFSGRTEYFCSIAEAIIDNFGDSIAITSNTVIDCKGFEPKVTVLQIGDVNNEND